MQFYTCCKHNSEKTECFVFVAEHFLFGPALNLTSIGKTFFTVSLRLRGTVGNLIHSQVFLERLALYLYANKSEKNDCLVWSCVFF